MKLILEDPSCKKKTNNSFECNVKKNTNWYIFGQCQDKKICEWQVLYPPKFTKSSYYNINHGIMERLISNPKILRKDVVLAIINQLGDEN